MSKKCFSDLKKTFIADDINNCNHCEKY